jgi:hypothetical protein
VVATPPTPTLPPTPPTATAAVVEEKESILFVFGTVALEYSIGDIFLSTNCTFCI